MGGWDALRMGAFLAASLLVAGCADDASEFDPAVTPTEVAVRPEDFLVGVDCSASPGAMQSYVVQLRAFESLDDEESFPLPATLPTPCSLEAGLRTMIVPNQLYIAEIDGYDVPASALTPFAGLESGSRIMLLDGEPIAPRWRGRCGADAESATAARFDRVTYVQNCEPLVDTGQSTTSLLVTPEAVLGPDPCSVASSFDLEPLEGALSPLLDVACDAAPVELLAQPAEHYRLYARATTAQGVELGAECFAEGAPGVATTPRCDPLSSQGLVLVDPGAVCEPGLVYDVSGEGGLLNTAPLACGATVHVGPFDPGVQTFSILVHDGTGAGPASSVACAADVLPGRTIPAVCL